MDQTKDTFRDMATFKVRTFWKTHKIWKILPRAFDVY